MSRPNLFSNIEAFGGKISIEDNEMFWIPGSNSTLLAFQISTNCMAPTLMKGDMAICKLIDDANNIKDGQLYAITIEKDTYIRRINRTLDRKGRITHLQLYTDNHNEALSSTIHVSQIKKILKVSEKMSSI